jgi:DNA-binding response OmpR family regulator
LAKKILIADDEPNIVTSLEFLFERAGYQLRVARDGEEALKQIADFAPDLVLLDVMLPLHNGFEVCSRIRENPDWNAIRVVMLTAKGRDLEISKGLALGADLYITKPFSTKDLVARVTELLADPK